MKRTLSLFVLLSVVVGTMLTGCTPRDEQPAQPETPEAVDTNVPPAAQ